MDKYKNNTARHGGELKDRYKNIKYDFSVNINPFGLPDSVKTALAESSIYTDYPDPYCRLLRNALAEKESVRPEQIVCGSGASDIIYRICEALGIKRALIPVPAFSEYERALELNGASAEYIYTSPDDDFALTDDAFEKWARECAAHSQSDAPDAVFLCDPTNPSGRLLKQSLIDKVYKWCRQNGALLIADECFLEFHEKRNDITSLNIIRTDNKKIHSEIIKNKENNTIMNETDGAPARQYNCIKNYSCKTKKQKCGIYIHFTGYPCRNFTVLYHFYPYTYCMWPGGHVSHTLDHLYILLIISYYYLSRPGRLRLILPCPSIS